MVFLAMQEPLVVTELNSRLQCGLVFFEQSLESVQRPFVNLVAFEMGIAAGLVMEFLRFLD